MIIELAKKSALICSISGPEFGLGHKLRADTIARHLKKEGLEAWRWNYETVAGLRIQADMAGAKKQPSFLMELSRLKAKLKPKAIILD
jgi:hypothetical protein